MNKYTKRNHLRKLKGICIICGNDCKKGQILCEEHIKNAYVIQRIK